MHDGLIGQLVEIVTVERNVEHTARQVTLLNVCDLCGNPRGNWHTTRANTDEYQIVRPLVLLDDLMCNPHQCAPNSILIHENGLFSKLCHAVISLSAAVQRVQDLLHVRRERRSKCHLRPRARMSKAERQ